MSWPDVPIKDVCLLAIDCVNKTAPVVEYETPYRMLRTTNVRGGFVDAENTRFVTEETFVKWTRRGIPQKGDVILTREAPLGDVGRLTSDNTVFLGQRLFMYRADPEKLNSEYLAYALQSPLVQGRIKSKGFGATVEHARVGDCENLLIPVPDLRVQERIGKTLSAYDDLIENNKRRIELLEESAHQLYEEWFVRFRFPGHEHVKIIDGVPEGWRKRPLNDLLEIKHGFAFKGEFFSDDPTSLILMTPGNFKIGGGIKLDKKKYYSEDAPVPEDYVLEENELLVTMTDLSKTSDTLGFPALVPKQSGQIFLHNQRLGKVSSRQDFYFPKYYFYHVFLDTKYRAFVVGSASGTSVKHTSPKKILSHEHLMPNEISDSLIEQFNGFAKGLYNQINTLISWNENLVKARDLLLPKLMSGEIAV